MTDNIESYRLKQLDIYREELKKYQDALKKFGDPVMFYIDAVGAHLRVDKEIFEKIMFYNLPFRYGEDSASIEVEEDTRSFTIYYSTWLKNMSVLHMSVPVLNNCADFLSFLDDAFDPLHDKKFTEIRDRAPIDYFQILLFKLLILQQIEDRVLRYDFLNKDTIIEQRKEYQEKVFEILADLSSDEVIKMFGYNGPFDFIKFTGTPGEIGQKLQSLREEYGYDIFKALELSGDQEIRDYVLQGKQLPYERCCNCTTFISPNRFFFIKVCFYIAPYTNPDILYRFAKKYFESSGCQLFDSSVFEFQGESILAGWFSNFLRPQQVDTEFLDKNISVIERCFSAGLVNSRSLIYPNSSRTYQAVLAPKVNNTMLEDLIVGQFIRHNRGFALDTRVGSPSVIGNIIMIYQALPNYKFNDRSLIKVYQRKILELLMQSLEICSRNLDNLAKIREINYFLNVPLVEINKDSTATVRCTLADALLDLKNDTDVLNEEQIAKVTEYLGRFGVIEAPNNLPGMKLYTSKEIASIIVDKYSSYLGDISTQFQTLVDAVSKNDDLSRDVYVNFIRFFMQNVAQNTGKILQYKMGIFRKNASLLKPLVEEITESIQANYSNISYESSYLLEILSKVCLKYLISSKEMSNSELDAVIDVFDQAVCLFLYEDDPRYFVTCKRIFRDLAQRRIELIREFRQTFIKETLIFVNEEDYVEFKNKLEQIYQKFFASNVCGDYSIIFDQEEAKKLYTIIKKNCDTEVFAVLLTHTNKILEDIHIESLNTNSLGVLRNIYNDVIIHRLPAILDLSQFTDQAGENSVHIDITKCIRDLQESALGNIFSRYQQCIQGLNQLRSYQDLIFSQKALFYNALLRLVNTRLNSHIIGSLSFDVVIKSTIEDIFLLPFQNNFLEEVQDALPSIVCSFKNFDDFRDKTYYTGLIKLVIRFTSQVKILVEECGNYPSLFENEFMLRVNEISKSLSMDPCYASEAEILLKSLQDYIREQIKKYNTLYQQKNGMASDISQYYCWFSSKIDQLKTLISYGAGIQDLSSIIKRRLVKDAKLIELLLEENRYKEELDRLSYVEDLSTAFLKNCLKELSFFKRWRARRYSKVLFSLTNHCRDLAKYLNVDFNQLTILQTINTKISETLENEKSKLSIKSLRRYDALIRSVLARPGANRDFVERLLERPLFFLEASKRNKFLNILYPFIYLKYKRNLRKELKKQEVVKLGPSLFVTSSPNIQHSIAPTITSILRQPKQSSENERSFCPVSYIAQEQLQKNDHSRDLDL